MPGHLDYHRERDLLNFRSAELRDPIELRDYRDLVERRDLGGQGAVINDELRELRELKERIEMKEREIALRGFNSYDVGVGYGLGNLEYLTRARAAEGEFDPRLSYAALGLLPPGYPGLTPGLAPGLGLSAGLGYPGGLPGALGLPGSGTDLRFRSYLEDRVSGLVPSAMTASANNSSKQSDALHRSAEEEFRRDNEQRQNYGRFDFQ